jgi:hypothetical protein
MKPVSSQSTHATANAQPPASSIAAGTPSTAAPRLQVPANAPPLFPAGHPAQAAPHDERTDYQFVGDVILRGGTPAAHRRGCAIL